MVEENPTNHKELLEELIEEVATDGLSYYEREAAANYWFWHGGALIALLISLATAAVAGLSSGAQLQNCRFWLVILPIAGSGVSAAMYLFQFREKEALREYGRIEVEDIVRNAKSLLISAKTEETFRSAFHSIRERYHVLELAQHRADIALRSEDVLELPNHKDLRKGSASKAPRGQPQHAPASKSSGERGS